MINYTLPSMDEDDCIDIINSYSNYEIEKISYYSFPQVFPSTDGPFLFKNDKGRYAGQWFNEFQMETYTDGKIALIFCKGLITKVVECKHGEFFTVDKYLNSRFDTDWKTVHHVYQDYN